MKLLSFLEKKNTGCPNISLKLFLVSLLQHVNKIRQSKMGKQGRRGLQEHA